jgi:hypothetical protein
MELNKSIELAKSVEIARSSELMRFGFGVKDSQDDSLDNDDAEKTTPQRQTQAGGVKETDGRGQEKQSSMSEKQQQQQKGIALLLCSLCFFHFLFKSLSLHIFFSSTLCILLISFTIFATVSNKKVTAKERRQLKKSGGVSLSQSSDVAVSKMSNPSDKEEEEQTEQLSEPSAAQLRRSLSQTTEIEKDTAEGEEEEEEEEKEEPKAQEEEKEKVEEKQATKQQQPKKEKQQQQQQKGMKRKKERK